MSTTHKIKFFALLILVLKVSSVAGDGDGDGGETRIVKDPHASLEYIKAIYDRSRMKNKPSPSLVDVKDISESPYIVAVMTPPGSKFAYLGIGVVIGQEWVLTTSSLVEMMSVFGETKCHVLSNTVDITDSGSGMKHKISSFIQHPDYKEFQRADVALLRVCPKFVVSQTARLATSGQLDIGTSGIVFRWLNHEKRLQKDVIRIARHAKCAVLSSRITATTVVVFNVSEQFCDVRYGGCALDDGTPFVTQHGEVHGFNFYSSCGDEGNDLFQRVHPYTAWVKQQTGLDL